MVGALQNTGDQVTLLLGFVQHTQKCVGHVIKPDLSSEMEGHFEKQKVHLFFHFSPISTQQVSWEKILN